MPLKNGQDGKSISIHAPREGSDQVGGRVLVQSIVISIHAPREGSDPLFLPHHRHPAISIHAPREGSDGHPRQR